MFTLFLLADMAGAEIKGKVYDPDWALVSNVDSYFKMSYDLSGVNGRPLYKPNRAYAVKL